MTKNETLFQKLLPRYKAAYLAANGHELTIELVYHKGYVRFLGSTQTLSVRVDKFEQLCKTLEDCAEYEKEVRKQPQQPIFITHQSEDLPKMVSALLDYAQVMQNEYKEMLQTAHDNGWRSLYAAEGTRIRLNIHQLKERMPDFIQHKINQIIQNPDGNQTGQ